MKTIGTAMLLLFGLTNVSWSAEFSWHDQPLFVITRNHYAEGHEASSAKYTDTLMIEILNDPKDQSEPYANGKKFKLYSRGRLVGSTKVKSIVDLQCFSKAAKVHLPPTIKLDKVDFILASNATKIKTHTNAPLSISKSHLKNFIAAAEREFTQKGFSGFKASDIKTKKLHATKLNNGSQLILGSVELKASDKLGRLFMIAEIKNKEIIPQLVKFHQSTDLVDGTDDEREIFVDQLDIDGDSIDEIFTEITGYETEEFLIYKKDARGWQQVSRGGASGC